MTVGVYYHFTIRPEGVIKSLSLPHCSPVIVNHPKQPLSNMHISHLKNRNRCGGVERVKFVLLTAHNKTYNETADEEPLVVYNSFAFQLIHDCCSVRYTIKDLVPSILLPTAQDGRKQANKWNDAHWYERMHLTVIEREIKRVDSFKRKSIWNANSRQESNFSRYNECPLDILLLFKESN